VFAPDKPLAGFIFYPGGKVEHTAYAPLLRACAERQVLCVFIRMPCNLAVLSVYGSEDGVLDMEKYGQYRLNLPADTVEVVIAGGCHAGVGRYGAQDGDGTPTISSDEQIARTAEEIVQMIG